jgi:hypothetical protein
MFTGIVSDIGTIESLDQRGDLRVKIRCGYDMASVDLGASIACSGVCLTVVDKGDDWFAVDVSGETLSCTAEGQFTAGRRINLERALKVGDELGGHIVTGRHPGVERIGTVYRGQGINHRRRRVADRERSVRRRRGDPFHSQYHSPYRTGDYARGIAIRSGRQSRDRHFGALSGADGAGPVVGLSRIMMNRPQRDEGLLARMPCWMAASLGFRASVAMPIALSLSNHASRRQAPFYKLRANGKSTD